VRASRSLGKVREVREVREVKEGALLPYLPDLLHLHSPPEKQKPHPMDRMRHDLFTQGKDLITAHLLPIVLLDCARSDNGNWS
jgi:hypothetical protein